tara:strand:- start:1106 stop:1579 length:474 start_codon:yes stop_codon:yes gene_type:complete
MKFKIYILFSLVIFSCDSNVEFLKYNSVNGVWHKDSLQEFSFELNETNEYNTFVNLRINEEYKFSNIFLITTLKDSLNILSKDTLQFKLADKSGKFVGKKRINLVDNKLLHKKQLKLEGNKKYFISIEHAMRVINKVGGLENLQGVTDIGYKIEKIN